MFCFDTIPQTRNSQRITFLNFFTKEGKEISKKEAVELVQEEIVIAYIKCDNGYVRGESFFYHICDFRGLMPTGCFSSLEEGVKVANPSLYIHRGKEIKVTDGAITIGRYQDGGFTSWDSPKEAEKYWTDIVLTISLSDPEIAAKIDSVMDFRKP